MEVVLLCPACRWLRARVNDLLVYGETRVAEEFPSHLPNCEFDVLGPAAALIDDDSLLP